MNAKLVLMTAACCLTLCSCTAESTARDTRLPDAFTVSAEMCDEGSNYSADMTRSSDGWEIVMTAPETVEGVTFHITGGNMTVRSGELSLTCDHENILQSSPVRLTAAVLDRCVKNKTEGELYGQHYAAEINSGKPVQLVVGSGFSAKFSGFTEEGGGQ